MNTRSLSLALLVVLAGSTETARGSSTVVPDDHPTVVAALAAGTDTIFVGQGSYPESLAIHRSVVVLPKPTVGFDEPTPFPRIGAIGIDQLAGARHVTIRNFHVAGYVRQKNFHGGTRSTTFENCRIDSGVVVIPGADNAVTVRLHGCLVFGGVSMVVYYPDITACTIVGGLRIHSHGHSTLRGNFVLGPAPEGIRTCCNDGPVIAENNQVSGTVDGFAFQGGGTYLGNTVMDVSGSGFRSIAPATGTGGNSVLRGNRVVRCGGAGFDFGQSWDSAITLLDNEVSGAGLQGAHVRFLSIVPRPKTSAVSHTKRSSPAGFSDA